MKVSELIGAELDYWVAMAGEEWKHAHLFFPTMTLDPTFKRAKIIEFEDNRKNCFLIPNNPYRQDPQIFAPSENWMQGGPIIEREKIHLASIMMDSGEPDFNDIEGWEANKEFKGETALIAAMRAFVASKFGNEVEDE